MLRVVPPCASNRTSYRDRFSDRLWFLVALASIIVLPGFANSQSFPPQYANALQRAQYEVMSGDVNGDGYQDVLVKAKPRIVLIDFDVPIPIPVKPVSPTFVLLSQYGGPYVLGVNPSDAIVRSGVWQPSTYDVVFGDVNGSGSVSMLLRARVSGSQSFLIATSQASGVPVLVEELTVARIGHDLSAPGTSVSLADTNRDGRSDLIIRVNGVISAVLVAAADGTFSKAESSEDRIMVAWRAFCVALDSSDITSASRFIAPDSQGRYLAALTRLGTSISTVCGTWSEPKAVHLGSDFAVYSVVQTFGGVSRVHMVLFSNESNGWALNDF